MELPKFLTRVNGKILCNVEELNLYIPTDFFEESVDLASNLGTKLNTFGVFYMNYRNKASDEKPSKYFLLNFPNLITIEFSKEGGTQQIKMPTDDEPQSYKVFTLDNGDVFLESETVIKGFDNLEKYVKLLINNKLPKTSYEDIYYQFMSLQEENEINLQCSSSILELLIAELTRYKKDKMIPFRLALGKGAGKEEFSGVGIKMLPNYVSAFAGISFENMDQSLLFAIDANRKGKPEKITTTEETIYL